jgi:hypothetical protein
MSYLIIFRYLAIFLSLLVVFAILSLSGTVGRLFGLEDKASAWAILVLGIFLALANAIFITRIGKRPLVRWGGAAAYFIVVCIIGGYSARAAYVSTPGYLIESISIKTVGTDLEGKSGHFETRVQLKILKSDIHNIFWGGLGSTGVIKNVTVSRLSGDFGSSTTEEAGQWQLHLLFSKPPKRGDRVDFAFGFDILGTEPDDKVYVVHRVLWPTRNLGITIDVPKERPCKTAEAYSGDAIIQGAERREESPPLLSGNNTELQWAKTDLQEGRRYIVICHQ